MSLRRPVSVSLAALALGLALPSAHAQQILQNFTGSTINNSGFIPPDTQGAVGISSYVELVNGRYAVYNKTGNVLNGTATALRSSSLDAFWQSAGITPTGGTFDPRVVYDPSAQRFYASALDFGPNSNHSNNDILLAVSNSSDPIAGWKAIKIAASQGTDNFFADFDTLGYNGNGVYLSVNNFPTTSPDGIDDNLPPPDQLNATNYSVSFLAISKANLASQTASINNVIYNVDPNSTGFVAHPVVDQDSVNGVAGTEYIFSNFNTPNGNNKVSTITGTTLNTSPGPNGGVVTVTAYNNPPSAQQPNGDNTLETGDTRFGSSVVKVGGQLWAVQNVSLNGRSGLNWVRLDAATNALIAEGTIGDASHDYYYGSIAVNGQGNVVIGYTRSGSTEFASSYASVGTYDINGSSVMFTNPLLLKAGAGNYDLMDRDKRNRWGDYSETTVDPSNPFAFWTSQEWASGTNAWSTQITEIGVAAAPEPSSLAAMGIGVFVLAGCIARKRRAQSA